ncbi:glycoside hydrolase family 15 protein [Flavitalea sp. BT771]|uniref:glycoside hydrolase family 15 protein n=1 Tax=Flavitalea sp. BT771 TaxID=3063329 RepID=UPI0026E36C6E|nr:glycoside hydrolase family 15 protein [Flavitalea sp. BT771]MDO6430480.1 glycoside hydrolase family 15 protein [Flavitalea sp. BT771]MDV6219380.1 glycoside hydrolase family 15 protein [Flavitalea sp. BT771]
MNYQPIENYGVIGDLGTVALVSLEGSVDFMCFPDFDSPSVFAALLDYDKGGFFCIRPQFKQMRNKQLYLPDTNVLLTRFLSTDGVGEITDFMPVSGEPNGEKKLVRRVTTIRGEVTWWLQCRPRFNYGKDKHKATQEGPNEVCFSPDGNKSPRLRLRSNLPIRIEENDAVISFKLSANQTADFILEDAGDGKGEGTAVDALTTEYLFRTVNYWKDWISHSVYNGRWMEAVNRSALVLKLLTSSKYGSIIAAPTFSLPEHIGGDRNWDYRYTWIRDASFTVYSFLRLGYVKEAGAFMGWMEKICRDVGENDRLGIMYSVNGDAPLREYELDNLEGYMGSSPVRVGNDAYGQLQLDIYGELMDSVYLFNKHGEPVSYDFWKDLEKQMDWLAGNWNQPDDGIWEVRGGKNNFLCSRLACWVALDRAIKIAEARSFPTNGHWRTERDKIYHSVYADFWDDEKKAFMQFPGSATVDASSLLMPLFRFISPKDPRWLSTLERIEKELVTDSLVYRYRPEIASPDGMISHEGTFSMCTFWYVECLSRAGQLEKARFYFEKMLGYANHLGLYSEQLGFEGQHLGNFPQAFTHLGLISAAHNLNKQLNDNRNKNVDGVYKGFPGDPNE